MTYNINKFPKYVDTAGKVTILTAFSGVLIFAFVFLFNVGKTEFQRVSAQTATTTLTVLNTPPTWDLLAYETIESSTSTPTNSGDTVTWRAIASDSNNAPYFLIVCSTNATPTANQAASLLALGTAPPECDSGAVQWGVSASTTSGSESFVSTSTTEAAPFGERNDWYAWVCDDDPVSPRCSNTYSTGYSATNSRPFMVNRRPVFTDYSNSAAAPGGEDPGNNVIFYSTSTDPDVIGGEDNLYLVVCSANTYNPATNDCNPGDFLASTTITVLEDASATYTLPSIIQDQSYAAYGFIVDGHGHEATGGVQGSNVPYVVNNVAPTVAPSSITLSDYDDVGPITLDNPAGESTVNYKLTFVTADANSCDAAGGGNADEIDDFAVGIFRSGVGSSTCDATNLASVHNPNNCYLSTYTPWNLNCTASTTTCTSGGGDDTMLWECTFPLWFVADPTVAGTPFASEMWTAAVSGIDDDNATGTYATSSVSNMIELDTFPAIGVQDSYIVYGALEPGDNSGTLSTTTTIQNEGNTGLDQNLSGEAMCDSFTPSTKCVNSDTATVPDDQQEFATSNVNYGLGTDLSSTTPQELELNVNKSISTSTLQTGVTYWGIAVPGTINVAGDYTGLNTFGAVVAETIDW